VKARFNLAAAYGAAPAQGPAKQIEQLRKVVELAPTFARAHLALGKALLRDGSVAEAIEALQEAARLRGQERRPDVLARPGLEGRTVAGNAERVARQAQHHPVAPAALDAGHDRARGGTRDSNRAPSVVVKAAISRTGSEAGAQHLARERTAWNAGSQAV